MASLPQTFVDSKAIVVLSLSTHNKFHKQLLFKSTESSYLHF